MKVELRWLNCFWLMPSLFILFSLCLLTTACFRPERPDDAPLHPGNHDMSLVVDELTRSWILRVPPAVNAGEPLPLLIVLHGGHGSGRKMQRALGFDAYADERNFYVAYPDAYQTGWRDAARWNDGRNAEGVDDAAFILALIVEVAHHVPLDASRVYATGASNGGMMSYRLGCETAGVFAGIAPVIANIPEPIFADCAPQAPLAFLAVNGSDDAFIPLAGGEACADIRFGCDGGWVVSQPESVRKFAAANGCDANPQSESLPPLVEDSATVEKQTYANCQSGAQVAAYIMQGGGHTWPPLPGQVAAAGPRSRNLDATQVIVQFFFP